MITLGNLNSLAGLRHGFFTREGGHSSGIYTSLNCGPGSRDRPENVAANRALCTTALGLEPGALVTVRQVHSAAVTIVTKPWSAGEAPIADGLVTALPRLALGVLTADCAPVLLADPAAGEHGVIGALHAGWRGAKAGILQQGIAAMCRLGARPDRIIGGIGPCLHRASYQVDAGFRDGFLADDGGNDRFFATCPVDPERFRFDLPGYVLAQLRNAGVMRSEAAPHDTYAEAGRFFSYRRSIHLGEPDYGRQLSAIALV